MNFLKSCCLILCSGLLSLPAFSQDESCDESCSQDGICCGTDPSPAGVMISHVHAPGEWMISYRYMHMDMRDVLHGNSPVTSAEVLSRYQSLPEDMRMQMHMVMLMYGINARLSVMGMFHYTSNSMRMLMRMGSAYHQHRMQTAGPGDAKLSALYALVKAPQKQFLVSFGINLPTGSVQQKGSRNSMMYPNQRFPYAMQHGSGSVDLLPCISYIGQQANWYYSIQLTGVFRTASIAPGYRYGNELNLSAWTAYRWHKVLSSSLRLEATHVEGMSGNDHTLDRSMEIAADPANYGSQRLFVFLGSVYQAAEGWLHTSKFCIEFGMPAYEHYRGYQMKNSYHLFVTYNLTF